MKISFAYWKHHKHRAFSIVFAIALSMAALVCSAFLARSARVTSVERAFDQDGYYDIMLPKISDDIKNQLLNDNVFAQTGLLYRGGLCRVGCSEPFVYGALSDKDAEQLLHFSALKGRYPENTGELAANKAALQAMGVYPEPGEQVILEMYDFNGKHIKEKQFTIVGVLDDGIFEYSTGVSREEIFNQKLSEVLLTRGTDIRDFTLPKVYLYPGDLSICTDVTLMGIFNTQADTGAFKAKLSKNGIAYLDGSRLVTLYILTGKAVSFSFEDSSEASLFSDLSDAQKDFNAQVLIPVFTILIFIITFLSTYDVVSTSIEERSRQFGLLRCMGMTQKSVFLRLAAEALTFVLISLLIGFIIGVFIYWLIVTIQINVFEMRAFYAFNVHKVINAITLNPYVYPIIVGFVCAFAAVLMPAVRHIFLSPLEIFAGLQHRKRIKARRIRKSAMRLLIGRLHSKLLQNFTTVIIVVTLMSAGFFGFLYFSAQAESSNRGYQYALENANLHELDYLAAKDFNKASCGVAQLNMHGTGVQEKELLKLTNSGFADTIRYTIEARSTKAVYTESKENSKIINAIEGCGLHPWYDFLTDLHIGTTAIF